MYLPYDSTIPLLGIYLQERKHEHIKRFLSEYHTLKTTQGVTNCAILIIKRNYYKKAS